MPLRDKHGNGIETYFYSFLNQNLKHIILFELLFKFIGLVI